MNMATTANFYRVMLTSWKGLWRMRKKERSALKRIFEDEKFFRVTNRFARGSVLGLYKSKFLKVFGRILSIAF